MNHVKVKLEFAGEAKFIANRCVGGRVAVINTFEGTFAAGVFKVYAPIVRISQESWNFGKCTKDAVTPATRLVTSKVSAPAILFSLPLEILFESSESWNGKSWPECKHRNLIRKSFAFVITASLTRLFVASNSRATREFLNKLANFICGWTIRLQGLTHFAVRVSVNICRSRV